MDRRSLILSMIDLQGQGLEIGPGYNPLLPKAQGYRVETLDHATQDELRAKYRDADVDLSRIEVVDHVSQGASILQAVGRSGCFDYIVASHVIEHTTNLLGFLQDCQALLKPGGVLVLAVPDKRHSFDALRKLSSTGDVLQAFVEGRTRHSLAAVFDEMAYNALRGGALIWPPQDTGELKFFRPLQQAKTLFEQARDTDVFFDIHAWQFTPSSFRLVLSDLFDMGYLGLREQNFHTHGGGEFITGLTLAGKGPGVSRLKLAQNALAEHASIAVNTAAADTEQDFF